MMKDKAAGPDASGESKSKGCACCKSDKAKPKDSV
jgi:hypothetical protein